ncbi:MAG: hypothetical protein LAO21_13230 [Acidobacteriia bacterium]|nr:hypothetical protein [Terriglobia bacterium]
MQLFKHKTEPGNRATLNFTPSMTKMATAFATFAAGRSEAAGRMLKGKTPRLAIIGDREMEREIWELAQGTALGMARHPAGVSARKMVQARQTPRQRAGDAEDADDDRSDMRWEVRPPPRLTFRNCT